MAERLAIAHAYIKQGYPIFKVLLYAKVSSSSWYYHKNRKSNIDGRFNNQGRVSPGYTVNPDGSVILDQVIVTAIQAYRNEPYFQNGGGYRKLKHYLKEDYKFHINHKKLYRLCKINKLLLSRERRKQHSRKVIINRKIYRPNQLWQFDIKYGY